MIKKVFLSVAVATLVFTACDSGNTTSPKLDAESNSDVSPSNSSPSDSLKGGNVENDSTSKTVNALEAGKVGCTYEKLSETSIVETFKELDVVTTVTATIKGATQEIEYYSTYANSVAMDYIQSLCEKNKGEAAVEHKNATVECGYRTMTIKEIVPAMSIDALVQSAKNTCEEFNAKLSDVEVPVKNANCFMQSDETAISLVIQVPDSINVAYEAKYNDDVLTEKNFVTFEENISKREIEKACDNAKANEIEFSTSGETRKVTCQEYLIKTVETKKSSENPVETLAPEMQEYCDEITRTGKYPPNR